MHLFDHINKRVAIGFGMILLALFGGFFYWLSGTKSPSASPVTVLSASPLDATLGRELLAALAKLQSTKLDTSVWSDPVFLSLKDFGVEIATQPVGRRNPFAFFDGTGAPAKTGGSNGPKAPIIPTSPGAVKKTVATSTPKAPVDTGGFDVE